MPSTNLRKNQIFITFKIIEDIENETDPIKKTELLESLEVNFEVINNLCEEIKALQAVADEVTQTIDEQTQNIDTAKQESTVVEQTNQTAVAKEQAVLAETTKEASVQAAKGTQNEVKVIELTSELAAVEAGSVITFGASSVAAVRIQQQITDNQNAATTRFSAVPTITTSNTKGLGLSYTTLSTLASNINVIGSSIQENYGLCGDMNSSIPELIASIGSYEEVVSENTEKTTAVEEDKETLQKEIEEKENNEIDGTKNKEEEDLKIMKLGVFKA